MTRATRRSICPVACSLDLLGDRWTLLVIRDLFAGKSRFGEFLASPEGIATNILVARLQGLQLAGLVATEPCSERAGLLRYRLTARGKSLLPVLAAIRDWGLAHIHGTEAKIRISAPPVGPCRSIQRPPGTGT